MIITSDKTDTRLRISIVEDDDRIMESFKNLVGETDGMVLAGAYGSCEEAIPDLEKNLPDVMLMDIGLPGMTGIEGVKKIKSLYPSIDVLMMTVYDDYQRIFDSICAGASGYMVKNTPSREIIKGIREIKNGAPMSPSIARMVLDALRGHPPARRQESNLTPRELEILTSLVDGLSYKLIADKLFLSPLTVHSHIKHIYEKLHVHSKAEAVSKALKGRFI